MKKSIAILIPAYNEAENLQPMTVALTETLSKLPYAYQIVFVDDGSSDETLQLLKQMSEMNPAVKFLSLSRNFGHQNALKAGIDHIQADAIISMDGDMQHPPTLLPKLLEHWEEGYDVVYTVRKESNDLSMLKRKSSHLFYRFLNKLSSIELEEGTADFRLMDSRVIQAIRSLNEYDLFWRGLVRWIGFKQIAVTYEPAKRAAGVSKYTFKKMMELALKGITSFSTKPLSIAIYIGLISSLLSLLYIPYALISYYYGYSISGWASIIVTIAFFGGLQLMILGIIGIYLGKLFMQTKNRPHYIVKETTL